MVRKALRNPARTRRGALHTGVGRRRYEAPEGPQHRRMLDLSGHVEGALEGEQLAQESGKEAHVVSSAREHRAHVDVPLPGDVERLEQRKAVEAEGGPDEAHLRIA